MKEFFGDDLDQYLEVPMIVKQVHNGYIVKHEGKEIVFESQDVSSDVEVVADLLRVVAELIGPPTNRYSKARISVNTVPGDKSEDK